jgi:hypothetical protein
VVALLTMRSVTFACIERAHDGDPRADRRPDGPQDLARAVVQAFDDHGPMQNQEYAIHAA